MRVIRWQKRNLIKFGIFMVMLCVLSLGGFLVRRTVDSFKCSPEESKQMLTALCDLYSKGVVAGNLCHDLCSTERMVLKKCLNYREGKKILYMDWRHWPVILKSEKSQFSEYFQNDYSSFAESIMNMEGAITLDQMVKRMIRFNLGYGKEIDNATDILSDMWSLDFYDYIKHSGIKNAMKSAIESLWSLIQQEEYVTMKFYQDYEHFPRIYGTCGHFYAMEYAPPGEYLDTSFSQDLISGSHWNERAKIAIGILDLIRSFEMDLHQPLHMCDTKGENFGLTADLKVKAIDTDMVFFEPKLFIEFEYTNCTKHSDCDYFDCKGWCAFERGVCAKKRINNNLQIVCEQIFLPYNSNTWLGLLRAPPMLIKDRLFSFLEDCANPKGKLEPDEKYKATESSYWRLYTLLKQAVDFEFDHDV